MKFVFLVGTSAAYVECDEGHFVGYGVGSVGPSRAANARKIGSNGECSQKCK